MSGYAVAHLDEIEEAETVAINALPSSQLKGLMR